MGSTKAWTNPLHERGRLLVHLRRGLCCLVRLCSINKAVSSKETGHGRQSCNEAIVLEGGGGAVSSSAVLLQVGEDRRRLVHDVGHRHGDPLLSSSKNPLQQFLLDAVELPNGPIAYGLFMPREALYRWR